MLEKKLKNSKKKKAYWYVSPNQYAFFRSEVSYIRMAIPI